MFTDTLFSKVTSKSGNRCAQVFVTRADFTRVYPMKKKSQAHEALDLLHHQVGVPAVMIPDGAKELTSGDFAKKSRKAGSYLHPIEAYTPNHNRAESAVRELKSADRRNRRHSGSFPEYWDHSMELSALIRSHTALDLYDLQGQTPEAHLTGDTPDISHLSEFGWWDFVWYINPKDATGEIRNLGKYLGPASDVGQALCAKILTEKGDYVSRTSVFPLSLEDENSPVVKEQKESFIQSVKDHLKSPCDLKT